MIETGLDSLLNTFRFFPFRVLYELTSPSPTISKVPPRNLVGGALLRPFMAGALVRIVL